MIAASNGPSFSVWSFSETAGELWTYEYDLQNRMTKSSYSGKGSSNLKERGSYVYDYRGLLVKKTYQNYNPSDLVEVENEEASKTVTEFYEYTADGRVIYNEQSEESDTTKTTYIWANTTLWCEINGGVVYYHHTDHLGTTEVITDKNGTVVWEAGYEAFGSVLYECGESKFTPSYTGKFFDKTSGLYYFNARWYDSELGKFTSSDPIRDGVNWWNYCNGNPITRIDFTGLETAGYNHRQGNYDLLPKLQGIDTGNKWYHNLWDGFVSYGLEGTYNLFATAVNTFTNGIGATNELANMASEAVFGADIDSITMTMMANGLLAPAGIMLNGFNTYMNGLKLANTSKAATTALSTVQASVNVGAGFAGINPLSNDTVLKSGLTWNEFQKETKGCFRQLNGISAQTQAAQVYNSFQKGTIKIQYATDTTYGLRFFDNLYSYEKGRCLFPSFTNYTNRSNLALLSDWNQMTFIKQFQIKPGAKYLEGIAAPQVSNLVSNYAYPGGAVQWWVPNIDLLK